MRLENKVAIVTGAASGIGKEIDEALADARQMSDVEAKRSLLAIAENYEQLAEQAARSTTEAAPLTKR
jgi:NAD(P)-dependent dehydrogenase (short-subunit alcohol dehydrogenase family)